MAAVMEDTPSHLQGNGRPVSEERTLTDLKVTGTIPAEPVSYTHLTLPTNREV